jgi:hypothetical protein
MEKQSPIAVFVLSLVTFGIYSIFWLAKRRGEMVRAGADIPTTWLIIVPLANIWYYWKWCMGVEKVTKGKMTGIIAFILVLVLNVIGLAVLQNSFNEVGGAAPVKA